MNRTLLLVLLAVIGILLGLLLPPMLVRNAVRSAAGEIAAAVEAEDMAALETRILPAQHGLARSLIAPLLPGHGSSLQRFKVLSMKRLDDGSFLLHAVFSFEDASWGRQVIEARMPMQLEGSDWLLNLTGAEARQFSLTEDSGWTKATDWLNLAQP